MNQALRQQLITLSPEHAQLTAQAIASCHSPKEATILSNQKEHYAMEDALGASNALGRIGGIVQ
jgi:hypothetical protein